MFFLSYVCYAFVRVWFICALWSPPRKELTSLLSLVVSNCEFVAFPGQVWYLIVSIPDICNLTYFKTIRWSRMIPT